MANITASMVKELRDRTQAGMSDCKNALVEAEGDMDKGVEIILNMRERMAEMQHQIEQFVSSLNDEISQRSRQASPEPAYSLIPVIEARRPTK